MKLLAKLKIQSKGLVRLLATTLLLAIAIPLINIYLIFPRYEQEIIHETEATAVRLGNHISRMLTNDEDQLTAAKVQHWANRESPGIIEDFDLLKIKIFDSTGTVLFSTSAADIGTVNSHDYFHNVVARGNNFSKVVRKSDKTLENKTTTKDVVETYAPMMKSADFIGAVELYHDITLTRNELKRTFLFSMLFPAPLIALFLVIVFIISRTLDRKEKEENARKEILEEQKNTLVEDRKKQDKLFGFVEKAKRQWETTMDCISELVFLTDPDFSIKRCNNAVLELTGLGYRDVLSKNIKEVIPDTNFEESDTTMGESFEYFHSPSQRTFFLSLFPVLETIDQEPGFVISMSDITSLKKMTEKLEQTNEEIITNRNSLQHALDNISLLIGEAIEGKEHKESPLANQKQKKCWETLECNEKDCACYEKEGVRCWQQPGTLCNGEVQGAINQKIATCLECQYFKATTQDPVVFITEQFNNLMFMLNQKREELQAAFTELKQTQGQLLQQEKMASVGQLAAGVAHEINNPVGFIASNVGSLGKYVERLSNFISFQEEILKTIDDAEIQSQVTTQKKKLKLDFILEDIRDLIAESLDGCERVKKIVQDLKSFSRIDEADRQHSDINECLDTTLSMVTNELRYKAKIEKEYGDISAIECHPQQLNQVFMNILINAAHAIEEEGVVGIKTWQDEQYVYTSISDTGQGIEPESLKHIFEPFFTTKDVGKGTGLGLSIVYDIITKNHQGDIEVESEVGKGTTFTIKLPRGEKDT